MPEPGAVPHRASARPSVHLEGVRQRFAVGAWSLGLRKRDVLRGIDLTLAPGEALALVGPNGSGKSTLLRILAGVDRPSAGRVEVLGASPASPAVRRRVGYLPEDSPFPRELGALAALRLFASLRGVADARRRSAEMLERVGLGGSARTRLAHFSRGMLRRFGLAQALVHAPQLVLLDEPSDGLDAQGAGALDDLLAEARGRGATLVLASHVPGDVAAHCERLVVLVDGAVARDGPLDRALAPAGRLHVELAGLDEAGLERARRAVEEQGGRWLGAAPSPGALAELYRAAQPRGTTRP